jgi:hypothetical protein
MPGRSGPQQPASKAAIYGLNRGGRPVQELEEAWVVHALVGEEGLTQVEAAELLGRDKGWVCRRLALVERLAEEAREDLRLGLLAPTAARGPPPHGQAGRPALYAYVNGTASKQCRRCFRHCPSP